ncbi:MAG: Xaa-Pro peptidase family protein [Candidatus Bipolaricaulota bacterium]
MPVRLSVGEFDRRREVIQVEMEERNLDALCVFSPAQVFYLTGFSFIATERPISALYRPENDSALLFVPLLEAEHAEEAHVDLVNTYDEYPGKEHPMRRFVRLLIDLELEGSRIGVDADGYAGGYGYVGPPLSELISSDIIAAKDLIECLMWIKSDEEIGLIRESCKWGDLAHRLLQEYTAPGLAETDVSFRASHKASMQMVDTLGPEYRSMRFGSSPAHADYRGQIGAQSAIPHSITTNAILNEGDVLVTGAGSEVGGYLSELERTMILGTPTEEQRRFFDLMLGAQELAFESIRPGVRCSDVDCAVSDYYRQHDIMKHWRHHTGHGIGYGMHEAPFLDVGDDTTIEPGMVLTIEPGIYVPGFAGFRHSDTILVTDTGIEILTSYPRDLDSLVIPV